MFKVVNGVLRLNIINMILADYGKYVYLVVTTLDISCKYFTFFLNSSLDIWGYYVKVKVYSLDSLSRSIIILLVKATFLI